MKATGIVRRIDDLGRVVIPKEIRRTLRIREGDPLEIFTDREGEVILKKFAKDLAEEKGLMEEFALYDLVERLAGQQIMEHRKLFKNVCANVDFYSGFVYSMLGIPQELFTPLFAIARMSGWSAHRLEELVNAGKIIRPAYKYVGKHLEFTEMEER